MITNPQEQIAQILKGKYFPNSSFWDAPKNISKSVYWSSVLNIRKVLRHSVTWQLGEGNISTWNQPWCDLNEDIYNFIKTNPMPSQLPVKVADLWNNEKERDNLKLNSQFEEEAVQKILQIPLMQDTSSDKLCWRFTKNGECNSKSAYREFYKRDNQNLQQVDSQTLALIKATWKDKNIPPKVKVFAWRFLREALPSSLTLNQRISDIPAACCRCGTPESDLHLFFLCPFSRLTWMISSYHFDIDRFQASSRLSLIIAFTVNNGPSRINLSNLFIIMWQLWKARNGFKFQGTFKEPSQVSYLADALISSFSQISSQFSLQDNEQSEAGTRRMDTIPNGIKCYLDAAWDNGQTGIGIFFFIILKIIMPCLFKPVQTKLILLCKLNFLLYNFLWKLTCV